MSLLQESIDVLVEVNGLTCKDTVPKFAETLGIGRRLREARDAQC